MGPYTLAGLAGLAVLLPILGFLAWRGSRSLIDPMTIPGEAWGVATFSLAARPWTALAVLIMVGVGSAIPLLRDELPPHLSWILPFLISAWRGVTAVVTAAVVIPVHLFALLRLDHPPARYVRTPRQLAAIAAVYGGLIWLLISPLTLGLDVWLARLPSDLPEHQRMGAEALGAIVPFIPATLLALIRPMLTLGHRNPLPAAFQGAKRHLLALYLVAAMIVLPPALISLVMPFAARGILHDQALYQIANAIVLTFVWVLEVLAMEVATVLFATRAEILAEREERRAAAAEEFTGGIRAIPRNDEPV